MPVYQKKTSIGILSWCLSVSVHAIILVVFSHTTTKITPLPKQQLIQQQLVATMVQHHPPIKKKSPKESHTLAMESEPLIPTPNPLDAKSTNQPLMVTQPKAPHYLNNPKPVYPMRARKKRQQGTVVLKITVSIKGKPTEISIVSSSGHKQLDDAAKQSVKNWTFISARKNNLPVEGTVQLPISFKLDDAAESG